MGGPGELELIGGEERVPISVVPYDDRWPSRFADEARRIRGALGDRAARVEHIGSTSVPGLAAKPIVDIQLSVENADDEASYLPDLESAGYALRVREPGHRMLRTPARDVHLHVCSIGSDWEGRHLAFRDWLRHDERDRSRYEREKLRLAGRDWPTMNHYADAKGRLIAEIMSRAESWASGSPAGG